MYLKNFFCKNFCHQIEISARSFHGSKVTKMRIWTFLSRNFCPARNFWPKFFSQNISRALVQAPLERFWINIIPSQPIFWDEVDQLHFVFKKSFLWAQNSPQIVGIVFFTNFRQINRYFGTISYQNSWFFVQTLGLPGVTNACTSVLKGF